MGGLTQYKTKFQWFYTSIIFTIFIYIFWIFIINICYALNKKAENSNLCKTIQDIVEKIVDHKIIFVGELHGTEEAPTLVSCLGEVIISQHESLMIGLELPAELEIDLHNYMVSATADERTWILNNWLWRDAHYQDGRRSRAMLGLLRRARTWRQEGHRVFVHTIDYFYDPEMRKAAGIDVNRRNGFMAARIKALIGKENPDHVVVLTGRGHARTKPYDNPAYANDPPIPLQLGTLQTWSIDVWAVQGERWSCFRASGASRLRCGKRPVKPLRPHPAIAAPVYRPLSADPDAAFDAELILPAFTASPPAWMDFAWNDCDRVPPTWEPCASQKR